MCDHCKRRAPGEMAQIDQAVAGWHSTIDTLIETVSGYLDAGVDGPHAASSIAVNLAMSASTGQLAALLGFAVLRLTEQQRAEMCPCSPDAPRHEHLKGGYALSAEDRRAVQERIRNGLPAWPEVKL